MIREHILFCECCSESFVELYYIPSLDDVYICASCRDDSTKQLRENTFTRAKDYGSF